MKYLCLLSLALSMSTLAQPKAEDSKLPEQGNVTKTEPTESKASGNGLPFTIDSGVDYKTGYFFRGYNIMDSGYIVQPSIQFTLNAIEIGDFSISPYVGLWANISEVRGNKNWKNLYETDVTVGVSIEYGKFTFDFAYNLYTYPSGASGSTQEVGITVSYDDSGDEFTGPAGLTFKKGQFLPIALSPHIAFFQEIDDNTDGELNTYFEAGVAPSFILPWHGIEVTVPVNFGSSLDRYYTNSDGRNDFFGFASIGIEATYKLSENWYLRGGVEYLYLFSDSLVDANGGDRNAFIGTIGIGLSL